MIDETWDSGITAYALNLSRALVQRGEDVVIALKPRSHGENKAKEYDLKTFSISNWFNFLRFVRWYNPDIINVHTGRMHSWGVFLSWVCGSALIRTRGESRSVISRMGTRWVYSMTDEVISASEIIRREFIDKLCFPKERVSTIYPGVDIPSVSEIVFQPPFRVGIIARLDPIKGHRDFLYAVQRVLREKRDIQFVITGAEANVKMKELIELSRRLGVYHSCIFEGYKANVAETMKSCHVGIISSIGSERISRVCLEWMAMGRPVVATRVGCLPEIMESSGAGVLVPAHHPSSLASSILQILNNPQQWSEMCHSARLWAQANSSMDKLVRETLAVYHRASGEKKGQQTVSVRSE